MRQASVIRGEYSPGFRRGFWLLAVFGAVLLGAAFVGWTYMVQVQPDFGELMVNDPT
jgi:hypothetical protein